MNRKEPQPLTVSVQDGRNLTVLRNGRNKSPVQVIHKPAQPSPPPPPKVKNG